MSKFPSNQVPKFPIFSRPEAGLSGFWPPPSLRKPLKRPTGFKGLSSKVIVSRYFKTMLTHAQVKVDSEFSAQPNMSKKIIKFLHPVSDFHVMYFLHHNTNTVHKTLYFVDM